MFVDLVLSSFLRTKLTSSFHESLKVLVLTFELLALQYFQSNIVHKHLIYILDCALQIGRNDLLETMKLETSLDNFNKTVVSNIRL